MSNVTNIDDHRPHEFFEVMCWHCGHRYIAVMPVDAVIMKKWECGGCGKLEGLFRTGQPIKEKVE